MTKTVNVEVPEVIGFDSKLQKKLIIAFAACGLVAYGCILAKIIKGEF